MRGTPSEITVATALAAATAEVRERTPDGSPPPTHAEIANAALMALQHDRAETAAYIETVVLAGVDDAIPYADLATATAGEVVCIDLTDGGTVWRCELDGETEWLPAEEFDLRSDGPGVDLSPVAIAWTVFFVLILVVAVLAAFWFAILPSAN